MKALFIFLFFYFFSFNFLFAEVDVDCKKSARESDYVYLLVKCQDAVEYDNNTDAAYVLGYMYQRPIYVSKNLKKAIHFYDIAARNGDSQSMVNLGLMYIRGEGLDAPMIKEGKNLILNAVEIGHIEATRIIRTIRVLEESVGENTEVESQLYHEVLKDF